MSDAADRPDDVDSVAEVRALRDERDEIDARRAETAMDEGYRQLAEQTTAEEAAEDRAITMSRRRRQAEEDAVPGPVTLSEWHHAEQPTDGSRLECLEGYWFVSPATDSAHQYATDELRGLLQAGLNSAGQDSELVALTGFGIELSNGRRTGVIPDVVVCTLGEGGRITTAPPGLLLVVEVWSPGNAPWEREHKRQAYTQARIPHFWELILDEGGKPAELVIGQYDGHVIDVLETIRPQDGPVTIGEPSFPFSFPLPVTIDLNELQL